MSGVRLEAKVHLVTCAVNAAQNIEKCIRRCGLEADDIILEQLASSHAILTEDEKELGVCVVDVGGGTTDIAVFTHGAIRHTAVMPIAGDQVTNDIAMALRTPTKNAEDLKCRYGCALRSMADTREMLEVPDVGNRGSRQLSTQTLAEVIEPRVEELYCMVQAELRRSGFEELLSSGIVITGGCASLKGMVELGEEIFHMPVRLGIPNYSGNLSEVVHTPRYSTGIGLILAGIEQMKHQQHTKMQGGSARQVFSKMRSWFQKNF